MLLRFSAAAAAAAWCVAASAQTVGFATLPPGSILHAQASVIAKVIQDNTKLQVRVVGYGGDTGDPRGGQLEKADFWNLDVGESADAYHGDGTGRATPRPTCAPASRCFRSRWRSGCARTRTSTRIADLKGKRVPSDWVQQTGVIPHTIAVLARRRHSPKRRGEGARGERGARGRRLQGRQARPAVLRGRRAQGRRGRGVGRRPAPAADESAARFGEAHESVRPEYYFSTVNPAPHIAGVDKPSPVQTIDVVLGVGAHVSDDVVAQVARRCARTRRAWWKAIRTSTPSSEKDMAKPQPSLPYHPGAIKYFKEAGIWRG